MDVYQVLRQKMRQNDKKNSPFLTPLKVQKCQELQKRVIGDKIEGI